ncbi:hypothetical protein Btru_041922 [Bulinus truncatus]|nr:hypothetical protein Btru_041922 [Bulinus truncatus]
MFGLTGLRSPGRKDVHMFLVLLCLCLVGCFYFVSYSLKDLQIPQFFAWTTSTANYTTVNQTTSTSSKSISRQVSQTADERSPSREDVSITTAVPAHAFSLQPLVDANGTAAGGGANATAAELARVVSDNSTAAMPIFVTASLHGRLGNQMFIYASLIGIARAQDRVYFVHNRTLLGSLFKVHYVRSDVNTSGWKCQKQGKYATYIESFMNLTRENLTLDGYFQSFRYFQKVENEVRNEFRFLDEIETAARGLLSRYKNRTVVGVHARRTDFLWRSGYGVPNVTYFLKAFSVMRSMLQGQNVTFLTASDDLKWCEQNLKDEDVAIVPPANASVHFALMASCDHVIISGGTFGWWTGWLSKGIKIYYKGYVIKGSRLENGFTYDDYYPPHWIGLDD